MYFIFTHKTTSICKQSNYTIFTPPPRQFKNLTSFVTNQTTYNYNFLVHNIAMLNTEAKRKLLGTNIAKYRKQKNLSQNQLAELVDVSREHIAKVETAKRNMSMNLLFNISSALNIPEYKFFIFK